MNKSLIISTIIIAGFAISCSSEPEVFETVVKGNFTIADSLSKSDDFSGIEVTIIDRSTVEGEVDTLMYASTNQDGHFENTVQFQKKKYYRLGISRNGENLGSINAILADNDSLKISGELPNLEQTLTLNSREHDAMKTYNRVDRQFQRVAAFIRAGAIPDSTLGNELDKWSNLYWEVFKENEQTIASFLAAEKSAGLLSGWDSERMLDRIDEALPEDYMLPVALRLAKPYIAERKGFKAVNNYLDSLSHLTENKELQELVLREKIKLHFDSSKVKEAKALLVNYEEEYSEQEPSKEWAKQIRYDLNYLAPGVQAPDFEFTNLNGEHINNDSLNGDVYILEISPLASREYQNDLDRTIVIHEIYKNYGLKILTIPLDQNQVTVDAFFEERRKLWPVAQVGSFDVQDIVEKFNVTQVPTRLLIDQDGNLIRKYVRGEFQDVIQGLNQAFKNTENPS